MNPKEFVEYLADRREESEGRYRFLSECRCQGYRDAVVAEAELRSLSEHPVLVRMMENY